mmetsp:Transcript_9357/g.27681  ORF Transcript_9357/g.27681 Transcript_9357/m.27681 type:complete len:132 (-) Transcript_9357:116-511(-)
MSDPTSLASFHEARSPRGKAYQLKVGDVVQARFLDGNDYLATIACTDSDGTCTISWFDGDTSCQTKPPNELQLMRFDLSCQSYVRDEGGTGHLQDHQDQHFRACEETGPGCDLVEMLSVGRRGGIDAFGLD